MAEPILFSQRVPGKILLSGGIPRAGRGNGFGLGIAHGAIHTGRGQPPITSMDPVVDGLGYGWEALDGGRPGFGERALVSFQ
ncbi:MAG: hypothetical protein RIT39_585 [Bacteroidota bacterium]